MSSCISSNTSRLCRLAVSFAGLGTVVLASACTTSDYGSRSGSGGSQPSVASYRCDDGKTLGIENRRSSVTVIEPGGSRVDLPADPPSSRTRYAKPPLHALELDGRDALYFVTGRSPLACKR